MVRLVLFLVPLGAGWLVVRFVGPSLARPEGAIGAAVWFAQAIVLATAVAYLVERSTRRFLPLAALLGMSLTFPDQAPSRFAMALRTGTVRQLKGRIDEMHREGLSSEAQTAAAQAVELVALLGRHERHTRGHTERVRAYTDLIAVEMGIGVADRQKLAWAALLHDIGKLSVPAEILNKNGRPTEAEWKILQAHPKAGETFVEPLAKWLGDWHLATSEHHERWDGDGYPAGLRGSNISLAGRIVAVADAYDVITAKRTYKPSMSPEAARRELVDCAGKQFDPDVVRAMLAVSVGSKRSSAWFSWVFELPGVSSLLSGAAAAPAVAVATVVSMSSAVSVVPVYAAAPDEIAYAAASGEEASPIGMTTTTTGRQSAVPTTGRNKEIPFASDPAVSTSSTTSTSDPTTSTTAASPRTTALDGRTTEVPATSVPTTAGGRTTTPASTPPVSVETTVPPTTTSPTTAPATTAVTSIPTTERPTTTKPPTQTACQRLRNGDRTLAGADLAGCDFGEAAIEGVDLRGANLNGADLSGVALTSFSLEGATLHNAELDGASFANGSMAGIAADNLGAARAQFMSVDLSGSSITNSDMSEVSIRQGSMASTELSGTNFGGARFQNLSFADSILKSTVFSGVQLVNVQMNRVVAHDSDFQGASLRFTVFDDAEFDRSDWTEADARDVSITNTRFTDSDLSSTNFKWAIGLPTFTETASFDDTRCPAGNLQDSDCWP